MKKAILTVSFGTSHLDTLEKTIGAIERELAEAFPDRTLYRAFTSGMVIEKLKLDHKLVIFRVEEAMETWFDGTMLGQDVLLAKIGPAPLPGGGGGQLCH